MSKDIRLSLFSFLMADSGIYAAVEGNKTRQQGGSRIFPIKIPQGVNAASIVYTRISGAGIYHMGGPSGLAMPRYQIDAWAPKVDDATTLANLIKIRIDGFQGVMGSGLAAVKVQGVFLLDEREDYDDTVKLHRVSRDYAIDFEEA